MFLLNELGKFLKKTVFVKGDSVIKIYIFSFNAFQMIKKI